MTSSRVVAPSPIDWHRISAAHPDLSIQSIEPLGEGWTSRSYLVNGCLVFRFPKRREVWEELGREIAFLAHVADLLPLRVPRYTRVVPASTAAAHGYAVYMHIPGRPLTVCETSGDDRQAAAERIATFLRALHELRALESIARQLSCDDERARALAIRSAAERVVLPELSTVQARRFLAQSDWYIATVMNVASQPVVIHADLGADHVLVHERRVSGVIDFSDVSLGDADYDFASLFTDVGEEFTMNVARRYGHSNLDLLLAKLDYFEAADHIDTIVNGEGFALPGQREAAWQRLRRCLS